MRANKGIFIKTFFKIYGMLLRGILIAGIFSGLLVLADPAWARKSKAKKGANPKYASIVVDADTGTVLHESHADKVLHPASLTKIMTLLLTFEALDQGRLDLNERIRMSRHAAGMAPSKVGLKAGETIRVKDAIGAIVTKSANDVSAAMAERLGGSEAGFARAMTDRARSIGMRHSVFVNASGLHDVRQLTTARDMAILSRYMILHYPHHYRYFSMQSFRYNGRVFQNHNHLMETYRGMDGIKTGYVSQSGFNLVASAVRNNHRLIGVVLGGRSTKSRNDHMAELLNRGFQDVGNIRVAKAPPASQVQDISEAPGALEAPGISEVSETHISAVLPKSDLEEPALQDPKEVFKVAHAKMEETLSQEAEMPEPNVPELDVSEPVLRKITAKVPLPARKPVRAQKPQGVSESEESQDETYEIAKLNVKAVPVKKDSSLTVYPLPSRQDLAPKTLGVVRMNKDFSVKAIMPKTSSPKDSLKSPWSVQIGAYSDRGGADRLLQKTLREIPAPYSQAQAVVAPMKTKRGWLFRARLSGFTKEEAHAACNYIKDCLPLAP